MSYDIQREAERIKELALRHGEGMLLKALFKCDSAVKDVYYVGANDVPLSLKFWDAVFWLWSVKKVGEEFYKPNPIAIKSTVSSSGSIGKGLLPQEPAHPSPRL